MRRPFAAVERARAMSRVSRPWRSQPRRSRRPSAPTLRGAAARSRSAIRTFASMSKGPIPLIGRSHPRRRPSGRCGAMRSVSAIRPIAHRNAAQLATQFAGEGRGRGRSAFGAGRGSGSDRSRRGPLATGRPTQNEIWPLASRVPPSSAAASNSIDWRRGLGRGAPRPATCHPRRGRGRRRQDPPGQGARTSRRGQRCPRARGRLSPARGRGSAIRRHDRGLARTVRGDRPGRAGSAGRLRPGRAGSVDARARTGPAGCPGGLRRHRAGSVVRAPSALPGEARGAPAACHRARGPALGRPFHPRIAWIPGPEPPRGPGPDRGQLPDRRAPTAASAFDVAGRVRSVGSRRTGGAPPVRSAGGRKPARGHPRCSPEPDLVAHIAARSEGDAFYAEELLATRSIEGELPSTLRNALLARVAMLSAPTRELLRIASAAGHRIGSARLAVVAGLMEARVEDHLREALDNQILLVQRGPADAGLVFRHALLQEAVYGELLPDERRRLHAAFARALAEEDPREPAHPIPRNSPTTGRPPRTSRARSRPGSLQGLPPRRSTPPPRRARTSSMRSSCGTGCPRRPRSRHWTGWSC